MVMAEFPFGVAGGGRRVPADRCLDISLMVGVMVCHGSQGSTLWWSFGCVVVGIGLCHGSQGCTLWWSFGCVMVGIGQWHGSR